ncbi:Ankyrin repeat protein 2 [Giardia muris]|uniref:Ankyrin repeat protein 2 n=1 Tax=Giardia muris TaxID=5742 RepID=A0A4Z1T4R1_GIAMU|nr:Ankyrin repeat protein 2 [Giardia muris]|eukprot:TNJ27431.1 Ankyrin repeat protein 2 [Giardia muris]
MRKGWFFENMSGSILSWAALKGDVLKVKEYLHEAGLQTEDGKTALMLAARNGHRDCVNALVDKEKELCDASGRTALHHAGECGQSQIIPVLLPLEGDRLDNQGWTALMLAVCNGHAVCARLLLSQVGKQSTREHTYFGVLGLQTYPPGATALMLAVNIRDEELVELLAPYEHSLTDFIGQTALQYAQNLPRTRSCLRIVDVLLRTRSEAQPLKGMYSLPVAAILGDCEMASACISEAGTRDPAGCTALSLAARCGHPDIVRFLREREQGMQDNRGWPALYYAISKQQKECANLLLMEADLRDYEDQTAFDLCIRTQPALVKRLITSLGVETSSLETALIRRYDRCAVSFLIEETCHYPPRDCTILMAAALSGRVDVAKRFLEQVGQRDECGRTALMHAIIGDSFDVAELLAGYESGLVDEKGWTALMYGVSNGHGTTYVSLLPQEVRRQTSEWSRSWGPGATALMMAATLNDSDAIGLLKVYEVGIIDDTGETALVRALRCGNLEAAKLLVEESIVHDRQGYTQLERLEQMNYRMETRSVLEEDDCNEICDEFGTCFKALYSLLQGTWERLLKTRLSYLTRDSLLARLQALPLPASSLAETIMEALLGEPFASNTLDNELFAMEEALSGEACVVCLSSRPDTVLLPCRHLVVCSYCADRMEHRCPYCREVVEEAVPLEIEQMEY